MTSIESVTVEVADPIASDAGPFIDPDGFAWEAARISERQLA